MSIVKTLVPDPTKRRPNPARNTPATHDKPQGLHDEGEMALLVDRVWQQLARVISPDDELAAISLDEAEVLDELTYGQS